MWQPEMEEYEFHLEEGLYWMEEGDFEEALNSFQRAIQADPDQPDAYFYIGYALAEQEAYDEALDAYRTTLRVANKALSQLEERGPWWVDSNTHTYLKALREMGWIHYKQGDYEDAINEFCRLLDLNPQDSLGVVHLLAEAYLRLNQPEPVMEIYELMEQAYHEQMTSSRRIFDQEEEQYRQAFEIHWQGKEKEKEEFFHFLREEQEKRVEELKLESIAYYNHGLAYWISGSIKGAEEKWEKGLAGNPFVASLLLEDRYLPLDDPEYYKARDYVKRFGDFWKSHNPALVVLRKLWKGKT
ncbi:MAG: tetratricopeptide repeat protein [Planctomycetota bacterium]|nr:MAG: tetratricopeptide repeat protein [Planctomycetota bacterium]